MESKYKFDFRKTIKTLRVFAAFGLFFIAAPLFAYAQSATPTPDPRNMINERNATSRRFETLKNAGKTGNRRRGAASGLQAINGIYRKPNRSETKILQPEKEDLAKYEVFLRQKNTGLTRLFPNAGCSDHSTVVNATEECLKFSMPGAGASFSFRTENYRIWRLADLTYANQRFHSLGVLLHGIIVNIGDVALEDVSMTTDGVKFIAEFEPQTEFEAARRVDIEMIQGIEADGFYYARSAAVEESSTFVLRSIAYRGVLYRSYQGFVYDEMDFDKREDVLIAFRVVRRDDESVSILWKELLRKDSPKMKLPQQDNR